jgi:glycosyltransferase involved in cell wall biosynthesis
MTSSPPARPRILYITNGFPFPLTSGYLRHYFLMGELASAGHDIVLLSIVGADHKSEHVAALADRTERIETFRSRDRAKGTVQRLIRKGRRVLPGALADPAPRQLAERAGELLRREHFDAAVFSGKRADAALARLEALPVVVDLCDATTLRLKREMAVASPSRRMTLEVAARRVRRTEGRMIDRADRALFASARDLEGLLEELADGSEASIEERARRSVVVPNGVDIASWSRRNPTLGAEIVLTGAMDYGPNVDAAVRLARTIFPLVRRQVPAARLTLVGRDPAPDVLALADLEGVRVTGYVEDVRPYLENAAVFAAPLRFGAGIQNKLLEAMSMAVPSVVSTLAADGLRTIDGTTPPIVVVDDDAATAEAISATLRRVAVDPTPDWAARAYVEQHFSWAASGRSLASQIAAARAEWRGNGRA